MTQLDDQKGSLRKLLLERRDDTSSDFLGIASRDIHARLRRIEEFWEAGRIGMYHPVGSEIRTQDIIQEALSRGREVCLPKVSGESLEFRRICSFGDLRKGRFDVMEPKDECPAAGDLDAVLIPAVGASPDGVRLGYGSGYYDRFLAGSDTVSVALTLDKQIISRMPRSDHDVPVDWIVTEDRSIRVRV